MEVISQPVIQLDTSQGLIRSIRFNADGQYAISCGSDRTIKLWRPSKLLQLKCYKGHSSDVIEAQANQDSSQFLSCSLDKSVILWDVETGKILRRFRNLAPFNSVCYGAGSGSTALAASADGTVRIYDLRALNAWEPIQSLTEASESVTCCKVFKHSILTISMDKCLRTYDVRNGSLLVDKLHTPLNHLSVSQDGGSLLLGCLRSKVLLLDRKEAKILNQFEGNENKLFKIESSFVLNDTCVAAGSEDGRCYVWSATGSAPKLALEHPKVAGPNVIHSISSDSLDYLLTSSGGTMFLWSLAK